MPKEQSYYERNRERLIAKQKQYNEDNREQYLVYQRAYYEQNKDRILNKYHNRRESPEELEHMRELHREASRRYYEKHKRIEKDTKKALKETKAEEPSENERSSTVHIY
jgi:hypothetical protein